MENSVIEKFRAKLREMERTMWLQTKNEASCCEVTRAQCHVILEIGSAGELKLKELSSRLRLDTSTLSRTVENLVKDGLVERIRCQGDRRATIIRLNAKGHAACDRINAVWNRICRNLFQRIPRKRHGQIIQSISMLAEMLTRNCDNNCLGKSSGAGRKARV